MGRAVKKKKLPPLSELYNEAFEICIELDRPDLMERLLENFEQLEILRGLDARPGFYPQVH